VFKQAAQSNAVLLLDELDTLNKRSEEITGGQQHINRLVNVLLTSLENAPPNSVIIMATNRADCLDPAIDRRLTLKLEILPAQTEEDRARLWEVHLKNIPLDCDLEEACWSLADYYPALNHGGHIKQVVMAAVRKAMLRREIDKLPLSTIEEAAQEIIVQLDLKQKKRMGFVGA